MRRLYSNPNDKFRTLRTDRVKSMSQLRGLPTAGDMAALDANTAHAELEAGDADRQERKHMLELIVAMKLVLASPDKRRRPRGVTKAQFKRLRALKLTRTARIRPRKKETFHADDPQAAYAP